MLCVVEQLFNPCVSGGGEQSAGEQLPGRETPRSYHKFVKYFYIKDGILRTVREYKGISLIWICFLLIVLRLQLL